MPAVSLFPAVNMWGGAALAGLFSELFLTIVPSKYTHPETTPIHS